MKGWRYVAGSFRAHYFDLDRGRVSLCGRSTLQRDEGDWRQDTPGDGCARCLNKLTQKSTGVGKQLGLQGSGPLGKVKV